MIKILILSGNHPRHFFINSIFNDYPKTMKAKYIFMKRENIKPSMPNDIDKKDKKNFKKHFSDREKLEKFHFKNYINFDLSINNNNKLFLNPKSLNSIRTINFIKKYKPDFIFIFGVDLISKKVLKYLKNKNLNLHLGLSPWYRGSATLFWPFYFLQPNYAGATFHEINHKIDDGKIFHQTLPKLKKGQKIHDVAINCLIACKKDLKFIIENFIIKRKKIHKLMKNPRHSGKLFFVNSFKPQHLQVIYSLFKNKIVDLYLNNKIKKNKPKIIKQF